jgi:hypothetical protein
VLRKDKPDNFNPEIRPQAVAIHFLQVPTEEKVNSEETIRYRYLEAEIRPPY